MADETDIGNNLAALIQEEGLDQALVVLCRYDEETDVCEFCFETINMPRRVLARLIEELYNHLVRDYN